MRPTVTCLATAIVFALGCGKSEPPGVSTWDGNRIETAVTVKTPTSEHPTPIALTEDFQRFREDIQRIVERTCREMTNGEAATIIIQSRRTDRESERNGIAIDYTTSIKPNAKVVRARDGRYSMEVEFESDGKHHIELIDTTDDADLFVSLVVSDLWHKLSFGSGLLSKTLGQRFEAFNRERGYEQRTIPADGAGKFGIPDTSNR